MTKLNEDNYDLSDGYYHEYKDLSDSVVDDKLIEAWFKFFQKNPDYKAYCEAKRSGDSGAEVCAALEATYSRITELYSDWGDIHDSSAQADWRTLFYPRAQLVRLEDQPTISEKLALISIPKGLKKENFLEVIENFLRANPNVIGDGPKYKLNPINRNRKRNTLLRIDQAEFVHDMLHDEGETPPFIAWRIASNPELGRLLGFRWFLHDQIDQLPANEEFPDYIYDYAKTIESREEFYQACIASTIHGVFPANTSE